MKELYKIYLKIIKNKEIKLLGYNKYSIYEKYINITKETLKLKPNKYKSLIIYNKNNKIMKYKKIINNINKYYNNSKIKQENNMINKITKKIIKK